MTKEIAVDAALENRLSELEEKVNTLFLRLDSLTSPVNETNIRATVADALRTLADEVEDEEIRPAKRHDPNEDEA